MCACCVSVRVRPRRRPNGTHLCYLVHFVRNLISPLAEAPCRFTNVLVDRKALILFVLFAMARLAVFYFYIHSAGDNWHLVRHRNVLWRTKGELCYWMEATR